MFDSMIGLLTLEAHKLKITSALLELQNELFQTPNRVSELAANA